MISGKTHKITTYVNKLTKYYGNDILNEINKYMENQDDSKNLFGPRIFKRIGSKPRAYYKPWGANALVAKIFKDRNASTPPPKRTAGFFNFWNMGLRGK
jgi:hypothetical protein